MLTFVVGTALMWLAVWLLLKLREKSSKQTTAAAKALQAAKPYSPPEYPPSAQLYGPPEYPFTMQGDPPTTQPVVQNTTVVSDNTPALLSTEVATQMASEIIAPTTPEVIVEQPIVVEQQSDGFAGFGGGETGGGGAGSNDWNLDTTPS